VGVTDMGFVTDMGQLQAAGTMRVVSEVQFEKAKWRMVFKPVGRVSLARAEQCEKASSQIMRSAMGSVRSIT